MLGIVSHFEWLVCWLVGCLVGWLVVLSGSRWDTPPHSLGRAVHGDGWLAGWLVVFFGCWVGWWVGWWVGRLVGWVAVLFLCSMLTVIIGNNQGLGILSMAGL